MRTRLVLGAAGLVLAVLVVLGLLRVGSGSSSPEPRDGWRGGAATGLGGWAVLLRENGVRLRIVETGAEHLRLLPQTTYLFAEGRVSEPAARRIADGVRAGARVVAVGPAAVPIARALGVRGDRAAPAARTRTGGPPTRARRVVRAPETLAVGEVALDGRPLFSPRGSRVRPLLATADGTVVAAAGRIGRGRIVLVGDRGPVENRGLPRLDDAAFAVALAGRGRVVALRPTAASAGGIGALPGSVRVAVALLVLAAGLALLARGRRLGPPLDRDEEPSPARSAYVDALAATLIRTRDRGPAAAPLNDRARSILRRRVGLAPGVSAEDVAGAARRAGLDERSARALAGLDPPDPQTTGRALARLEGDHR